ncbi:MAG: alkaline phosphatase family protein [bacterium]|nr:alkaline phosphatase family protein [bacterium]
MKKNINNIFLMSLLFMGNTYAQPKLIIQIVIDQLRGDLIQRHAQQFGTQGFNYLLNHSINFQNAHHPHANTTTCVGHATIATGSYPLMHGVIDNDWYDRKTKKSIYCMEDLDTTIVPTIHTHAVLPGRSPLNLKASTLSDELVLARKGNAFAVSLKDRSAITLAGHSGKAFWFDKINGGFVTSRYYYSSYPQWVQNWNSKYKPKEIIWKLSRAKNTYQNAKSPIMKQKADGFGAQFPHKVTLPISEEYFKFLSKTPEADKLTADFAEQLLINEHLGHAENHTDYLAISFSAVDVIGHQFSLNSLEAEDNLLMLDKTLSHLLSVIDKHVGLNNTLIVLTADHGAGDGKAYLNAHHILEIKPIDTERATQAVKNGLYKRFQLPEQSLTIIVPPYVYLNHKIIHEHHLNLTQVSQFVADILNHQTGVYKAYPLPVRSHDKNWITEKVNRMAYPGRSGDVYLVPPPYGSIKEVPVAHNGPWQYDSFVPLLFVSPSFKAQQISRPVFTTDIATTLTALLMIKPPSAAVGVPLDEVLNQFNSSNNK